VEQYYAIDYILVNFANNTQTIKLPSQMYSILDGKDLNAVALGHDGVAVLEAHD